MPSKLPRALCPVCGRPIVLTLAGRLRVHGSKQPGVWPPENCAGSRQNPKPDDKETPDEAR